MKKPKVAQRLSDDAVKERTGKIWADWFKILDKAGAKKWPHKEIAAYLLEKHKVGGWWSQMVAVGYEHERGLREKFQKCDGEFSASSSRTLAVPVAKLYTAWTDDSPQGAEYRKLYMADLDRVKVSYSGSPALKDRGDYVRLDGPRVWIEYATQGSDHVHTIWRDRLSDYGAEFSF